MAYAIICSMTSPGKAIWTWFHTNIDQIERGDGEGWQFQGTAQLTPNTSIQRAILRIGIAGSEGGALIGPPLPTPAWLGSVVLALFSESGAYDRPLWVSKFGMATSGWTAPPAGDGTGPWSFVSTWAAGPIDIDLDVRKHIGTDEAVFLAWIIGAQPVPEQFPSQWDYGSDWPIEGQLQWLQSFIP
jgi:hypothetical protein